MFLDDYFKLKKEIFEYFGYKEDWKIIPLDDHREYEWGLLQKENGSGKVLFAEKNLLKEIEDVNEYYGYEIYTQRFLPKYVYKTDDYTMICSDTQTDGNKVLAIFDNKKEINIPASWNFDNFGCKI